MSPERIRPGSARIRPGSAAGAKPDASSDEAPLDADPTADAAALEAESKVMPATPAASPDGGAEHGQPAAPDDELERGVEAITVPEAPEEEPAAAVVLEPAPGAAEGALASRAVGATPSRRRPGLFKKLYYGQTRIDFVRHRRTWFAVSSVVILAGVISLGARGLNLSIDFVGGTAWTIQSKTFSITEARNTVTPFGLGGSTITVLGQDSSTRTVEVEAKLPKGQSATSAQSEATKVADALGTAAHVGANGVSVETVGPSWGGEITHKAVVALIVFFIMIALYISIFFEWRMALAAIIAVAHDILVTVGIYSLTFFEVTPDTVVAILTILGYSLYDTIVVFDRIRDNVKVLAPSGKLTFSDLVNLSMNQTLARSINTSLVAIMPILAVLVLGADVLGATTLQYFGLALLIGLASGAYSSIFIASPIVAMMKEREQRYRNIRERLLQRGGDRLLLSPADIAAGILGQDGAEGGRPATPASARRQPRPSRAAQARRNATPARRPSPTRRKGGRR